MDFSVIRDNWEYLLFGTFLDGPLEGAALTLVISLIAGPFPWCSGLSAE